MQAKLVSFGQLEIEGRRFDHDVVVEAGRLRRRDKKPSKARHRGLGHTPLTAAEDIPWSGRRLIIGSGAYGRLPVLPEVFEEAERRGVELVVKPTAEACRLLDDVDLDEVTAILHVTC
jgi:hypothetical protein